MNASSSDGSLEGLMMGSIDASSSGKPSSSRSLFATLFATTIEVMMASEISEAWGRTSRRLNLPRGPTSHMKWHLHRGGRKN
jgi:hypothetical protein